MSENGGPDPALEAILAEHEEQEVRDHFGYASSETRTRGERQAAADRILAKLGKAPPEPLTEEVYVAREMAQTEAYILGMLDRARGDPPYDPKTPEVGYKVTPGALAERRKRAEAYARWHWAAFHAGEVVSL